MEIKEENMSLEKEVIDIVVEQLGIDEADVRECTPVIHKIAKREQKINFLAPGADNAFDVLFTSNYPRIEIYITKLRSKEISVINEKLNVFEYNNSDFIQLGDSDDYRKMIGV